MAVTSRGQDENLFGQVKRRIDAVIQYVFFHKGVLEDKSYGFMHMFYLYGFLILGIGHLELVLYGLSKFLKHFDNFSTVKSWFVKGKKSTFVIFEKDENRTFRLPKNEFRLFKIKTLRFYPFGDS